MKKIITISMILLTSLFMMGCQEESVEIINTPAFDSSTVSPAANESGSVRAYVGTEVTASGFNLDKVTDVMVDDVKAEIINQTIKTITFKMPAMDLAQQDAPHNVVIKAFDGDQVVFTHNYYLTIPVTDALVSGYEPKSGTVGQVITIAGRNLEQVTSVSFNGVSVIADFFAELKADALKVAVPALAVESGNTAVAIKAVWGNDNHIDVTGDHPFTLQVPYFAAYTQTGTAKLADEFVLSGENLDLVEKVLWGTVELLVVEKTAESMTVKIPTSIEKQEPVVAIAPLTATYGTPVQTVTVASEFSIDTTPMGPAAPIVTSALPTDNTYTGFYLAKEVTLTGQNMASIEKIEIDGIAVDLTEPATDIAAKFIIPSTISGTQAKSVNLVAIWNGGNRIELDPITVHPFYYTKGLKLRLGSNSKSTYPAANRDAAFLALDEGRVMSVEEYKEEGDEYAMAGANAVVSGSKTKAGVTAEQYYAVKPYTFATADSSNKLAFQNPASSTSQLKCHRDASGTSLPGTNGTPIVFMGVLKDEVDNAVKAEVKAGALTDILSTEKFGGASAPAYGAAEGDTWVKGSVIRVQYVTFGHASGTGGKPTEVGHVHKTGYIHITDVTCGDPTTGKALANREGYIELDLYWSNVINE